MKKLVFLLMFILSTSKVYTQNNEAGLRFQLGFNSFSKVIGGGAHFAHHVTRNSTARLLIEFSHAFTNRSTFISAGDYNLLQLKLQYLYYFSDDRKFHVGIGGGKFFYNIHYEHARQDDRFYYIMNDQIDNTFGMDILAGMRLGEDINIEINYTFSYPETTRIVEGTDENNEYFKYEEVRRITMNTVYLNAVISFEP